MILAISPSKFADRDVDKLMTHHKVCRSLVAAVALATISAGAAPAAYAAASPSAMVTRTAPKSNAHIKIVNFMFMPMSVTIKVGGTVTWTQVDKTGHSVQSSDGAWKTSKVLKPGQTFSHKFTKAGTYSYICGVHNFMKGTIKVEK